MSWSEIFLYLKYWARFGQVKEELSKTMMVSVQSFGPKLWYRPEFWIKTKPYGLFYIENWEGWIMFKGDWGACGNESNWWSYVWLKKSGFFITLRIFRLKTGFFRILSNFRGFLLIWFMGIFGSSIINDSVIDNAGKNVIRLTPEYSVMECYILVTVVHTLRLSNPFRTYNLTFGASHGVIER